MFNRPYTYKELKNKLQSLPKERLDDTATVYIENEDEYYPIVATATSTEKNDVLDTGHFYLVIE